jgi:hypothetical protein
VVFERQRADALASGAGELLQNVLDEIRVEFRQTPVFELLQSL